jgi:hypothetical protein
LPCQYLWDCYPNPTKHLPRPLRPARLGRVANPKQLHPEPANLPNQQRSQNRSLPSGLRRAKRLHAPKRLPRPLRPSGLGPVEPRERLMHEVSHQPHKPTVPGQSGEPYVGAACATTSAPSSPRGDTGRSTSGEACGNLIRASASDQQRFSIRCPITGTSCTSPKCGEWCAGSRAGTETDHGWGFAASAYNYRNFDLRTGDAR